MQTKTLSLTRILLLCGAIAGPLFLLTVLIQGYTRPAFDPRLQPLSLLSLGDWGWVQIVNFVLAGVLNLLYAGGLWRRLHPGRAGIWGPLLIGAYGLGLIAVGVFRTDPANVSAGCEYTDWPLLARRYPCSRRPLHLPCPGSSFSGICPVLPRTQGALVGFLLSGERRISNPVLFR
jgi:hypothetical protein